MPRWKAWEMQIGEPRDRDAVRGVLRLAGRLPLDGGNPAVGDPHPHVAGPAVGEPGLLEPQVLHRCPPGTQNAVPVLFV
jgi:hypothetical protein